MSEETNPLPALSKDERGHIRDLLDKCIIDDLEAHLITDESVAASEACEGMSTVADYFLDALSKGGDKSYYVQGPEDRITCFTGNGPKSGWHATLYAACGLLLKRYEITVLALEADLEACKEKLGERATEHIDCPDEWHRISANDAPVSCPTCGAS